MSVLKASLIALALLVLPQAAGGPDDLAELFPSDAMVFAEVSGVAQIAKDWKEYAGAYFPEAKRKELLEKFEKASKEAQNKIPEKLLKDLEKGAPSMQRVAAAFRMGPEGPEWAVAASSADPAFFKKILEEDLKVFSSEEKAYGNSTILTLRKLGDVQFPSPVYLAAAGRRMALTSDLEILTGMLDRASGKAPAGGDLRSHPTYRQLAPAPEGGALRAFSTGIGSMVDGMSGMGGMGRRSSAHSMDKVNALLGIDKIGGLLLEASFRPGKMESTARLQIGSPCPLYDVWRQPAGPKDLLKFVPEKAAFVAHVNLKSGKELWAGIESLMNRHDEIEALGTVLPPGEQRRRTVDEANQGMQGEIGASPAEIFGALGDEAALALLGPDAFAFNDATFNALLVAMKAVDPAAAKALLRKVTAKIGQFEEKEQDGTLYFVGLGERGKVPVFALSGNVFLASGAKETIEAATAVARSGKHYAAALPADARRASKLLSLDLGAMWKALVPKMGPEVPEELRGMELDLRSLVSFEEKPGELLLRSGDGVGLAVQASLVALPALFLGVTARFNPRIMAGLELPPEPAAPVAPAPALPADQVAAKVKALVADLQADDVVKREEAAAGLRALGPQAIPAVVAAFKASSDAETRGRLLGLLVEWKAYDAMPEVLTKKVEAFLEGLRRPANPNDPRGFMGDQAVQWYRHEGMPWTYCMEPSWVNEALLKSTAHVDVLQYPVGAKAAAAAASGERTPVEQRKKIASLLAYVNCGKAGPALIAARDGAADAEVKSYLQISLGWSEDPACRKALLDGLKDGDVWLRRSSFIAAERSTDPAVVDALLELLKSADMESRWNAAYTLKAISKGKVVVNPYAGKAEVDAAVAAATAWWTSNKATFKPGK